MIAPGAHRPATTGHEQRMEEMMLRSAAFHDHALMPSEYSHDSGDVSPPLEWS
jgi:phosphatidylethanolamine-binding protein (PEBP) family uncharacterized protein